MRDQPEESLPCPVPTGAHGLGHIQNQDESQRNGRQDNFEVWQPRLDLTRPRSKDVVQAGVGPVRAVAGLDLPEPPGGLVEVGVSQHDLHGRAAIAQQVLLGGGQGIVAGVRGAEGHKGALMAPVAVVALGGVGVLENGRKGNVNCFFPVAVFSFLDRK